MAVPSRGTTIGTLGRQVRATRKLNGGAGGDVASTTSTATANLSQFNTEDAVAIDAQLNVTAESGTAAPSMTVTLQTSFDGATWTNVGSFPAMTATGTVNQAFTGLGLFCRWVISALSGTTPSFTWNIDHQARTLF
jgi:hypothetical protein